MKRDTTGPLADRTLLQGAEAESEDQDLDRTSANALKVQVWTALIAMLILKYLQLKARFAWSLSNLVALLRMNLFTHRDVWAWLDRPLDGPPTLSVAAQQAELALA
jgi:hypothetical protein